MSRHELGKPDFDMIVFALRMTARGIESKTRFADKAPAQAFKFRDLADQFDNAYTAFIEDGQG